MSDMLTIRQIKNAKDFKIEQLKVQEWGKGHIFVRTMHAKDQDAFEQAQNKGTLKNYKVTLALLTVCDENGVLLFNAKDDEKWLAEKSGSALTKIFNVAMKLNWVDEKDIKEMSKN